MIVLFWYLVGAVVFIAVGYGAALILLSGLVVSRRPKLPPPPLDVTLLIAAHNEEHCIAGKLRNALAQEIGPHRLSIVVVSDGSTDGTGDRARSVAPDRVRVIDIRDHVGKIPALRRALRDITGDVVVFSDANSTFRPGALAALLAPFGDDRVGGVCGAPAVRRSRRSWLAAGEHLYWHYDNRLKQAESALGGVVSAQGSLYAVRRALVPDIPTAVADDFYISTAVPAAGFRLAFAPDAISEEAVAANVRREFGRRVRSTERGWRALLLRRGLLNPLRTGPYAVHLLFHKLLRRMVPVLLLALLVVSALGAPGSPFLQVMLVAQVLGYSLAIAVPFSPALRRVPGATIAFFVLETQAAMVLGLARVAMGRASDRWTPVREATGNGGARTNTSSR